MNGANHNNRQEQNIFDKDQTNNHFSWSKSRLQEEHKFRLSENMKLAHLNKIRIYFWTK